jgi:hypothetical protein
MRALCRAICLIALFVTSSDQESNQESGASKQLATQSRACGAICLIALFVTSSDQESNRESVASNQLATPLPYMHLLTDLNRTRRHLYAQRYSIGSQRPGHLKAPYP